jgi:twitching motility protein PilJ
MAFSTQYAQQYQQAVSAYMQKHYATAAEITDALVSDYPDEPNLQLLCGHIYSCLNQYEAAQRYYKKVLQVTTDPELLNCAQNSLLDLDELLGHRQMAPQSEAIYPWGDGLAQAEGDVTQIQIGDRPPSVQSISGNGAGTYQEEDIFSSATPALSEKDGLDEPQAMSEPFNDQFEDGLEAETPPSLFDDEEEDITLLMGKKGSRTPEGSMLDAPASEKPIDAAEYALEQPDEINVFGEFSDERTAVQDASLTNGYPEDNFSNFLEQMEHPDAYTDATNAKVFDQFSSFDAMPDLSLTPDLGGDESDDLGFQGWGGADEDLTTADSLPSPSPEYAPAPPASAPVRKVSRLNSDEAAALNMASHQMPVFAVFENAPLQKKPLIMAASSGIAAGVTALVIGQVSGLPFAKVGLSALAAGLAGGATTLALSHVVTRQMRASTSDLQTKLSAVAQGDWSVKAIEFSKDEFGQLAKSFNKMTHFIEVTTQDAQRKAEEQEKAKEDLQRQVIRLLDDVEGAARGDLTVQAEVTADILGAVADSFNLTIYNLQKIVKQVKVAAREVNKGAADNEEFARGLSSDALRQAEELAATLNSVQMMTTSIQAVAESARAADGVAQKASEAALRGGESVESTVAGILQIRETVAETTRKVKRLAESSQEISKIVGLISQIASRTNLLALNASIEAARAGESGRGFAVVADEVRQLADRAAKASKEIEQIVLQIQGETSSVMTAMEEGTQQVIEGTQRAEQAKNSLEDIIQVSAQIKQLVGSITQATAEQTETSRYVGQVMQSVELTAQETSQEAQRVSDSLRSLVGVARDLQSSVERFKVEGTDFS